MDANARSPVAKQFWLGPTATPDHNEAGHRPTKADGKEAEFQASDRNRQRERTLQTEDLS